MSIYSIEIIEADARAATKRYSDVNAACPFPFQSPEGIAFKTAFNAERQRQEDEIQNAAAADIRANAHKVQAVTDWSAA